jgi:hypothetical protein
VKNKNKNKANRPTNRHKDALKYYKAGYNNG